MTAPKIRLEAAPVLAATTRRDVPLVISRHDADLVAGTAAEGGTVVSVQIVQNGANLPPLTPTMPLSWLAGYR